MAVDSGKQLRRCDVATLRQWMSVWLATHKQSAREIAEEAVWMDSPDTSVVVPYDHLVRLELADVELDVGELEGSVRLLDDERLCLECLCHDVCAEIWVERVTIWFSPEESMLIGKRTRCSRGVALMYGRGVEHSCGHGTRMACGVKPSATSGVNLHVLGLSLMLERSLGRKCWSEARPCALLPCTDRVSSDWGCGRRGEARRAWFCGESERGAF